MPGSQPTFECKRGKRGKRGKGWYWNRLVKILQPSLVWVQLLGPHPMGRRIANKIVKSGWNLRQYGGIASRMLIRQPTHLTQWKCPHEAGNGVVSCCVQPSQSMRGAVTIRVQPNKCTLKSFSLFADTADTSLVLLRGQRSSWAFFWLAICLHGWAAKFTYLAKKYLWPKRTSNFFLISVASVAMMYTSWNTEVSNDSPYQAHRKTGSCWNS